MTVTIDQAMRGILRFFDTVASPHMDEVRSFVAGVGLSLLADGSKEQLLVLRDNPWFKAMRIMDEHGDIDIDRLYNKARPRLDGRKLPIKIPFIGKLTFVADDIDSLYKCIQEA